MKKFFSLFAAGAVALLFVSALSAPAFAQDEECTQETKQKIYDRFTSNYTGNLDQQKVALDAAKDFIKLCGSDENSAQQVEYLKNTGIPWVEGEIEKKLKALEQKKKEQAEQQRLAKFDQAYRANNWEEAFAAGEAILKEAPVKQNINLDLRIVLASRGSVLAEEGNTKFVNETLKHAQDALSRIAAGEESTTKNWGAYDFEFKTKDNALGWLNYGIGSIKYNVQGKQAEGVKFFYEATQHKSGAKDLLPLYVTLGDWYRIKAGELGQERAKLDLTEAAGEMQKANIDKALEIVSKEKAYAERAMDAYARAYNLAKSKNASEEVKTGLYNTIKSLFAFRYDGETQAEMRSDASINSFVNTVASNALPNPANEPAPVVDKKPGDAGDSASDGSSDTTGSETSGQRSRTVSATAKKTGNR